MPELVADPRTTLSRFGLRQFRSGQREVIDAVLAGQDVLCVMPTGGGKSLCYQLPALLLPKITLVVSPLIALMKDQEDQLRRLGIPVTALHSGLEPAQQRERLDGVGRGEYSLIYAAPERFKSSRFLEQVARVGVSLLAVDEAHCISEWGHDFRPDYARLGWIRQKLGQPTTIALTATATDIVRRDIVGQLGLQHPAIFIRGFDRPNLRYAVTPAHTNAQKKTALLKILGETPGSIIVYAASRRACEEVAGFVRERAGRGVVIYHAGLLPEERRWAQDTFMSGRADVVVATNAFGMGIDKPDIRAVVHFNLPGTLEAYYQEAGRAGRDGAPADCHLLFGPADRIIQEYFIENEYPPASLVRQVLGFLRGIDDDPIELTRAELKSRMNTDATENALGTCLKLLERAGVIERLRPRENMAIVRIHETGPAITDLLPAGARTLRRVLGRLDALVGDRRGEDVYFLPDAFAESLEMDRSAFTRAVREIAERIQFDYIPPFRGNATRLVDRTTAIDDVRIDFGQLEQRKAAEYAKLARVFDYAGGCGCRRATLLDYFGESITPCGNCDRCEEGNLADGLGEPGLSANAGSRNGTAHAGVVPDAAADALSICLAAVAELRGRFGKILVSQTLTGSNAKSVTRFGLQKRRCFGQLAHLRQADVVELLEALLLMGLAEPAGERMRATIAISAAGGNVLAGQSAWPPTLPLASATVARIEALSPPTSRSLGAIQRPNPSGPTVRNDVGAAIESPADRLADEPIVDDRPDYYWTWRLLQSGFSLCECALARRLSLPEVGRQIESATRAGWEIPLAARQQLPEEQRRAIDELAQSISTPIA